MTPPHSLLPLRAFKMDFLVQVAVMALERWDRLTPSEQIRFRELATRANGSAGRNLRLEERKELKLLWRKLEARKLLAEIGLALRSKPTAPSRAGVRGNGGDRQPDPDGSH
jgi:hypothetical protein